MFIAFNKAPYRRITELKEHVFRVGLSDYVYLNPCSEQCSTFSANFNFSKLKSVYYLPFL